MNTFSILKSEVKLVVVNIAVDASVALVLELIDLNSNSGCHL